MPKPPLRQPFDTIATDVIATLLAGLKEWRPDLSYPESHSDMRGCVMALLRKYDVTLRPVPLDRDELVEPPPICPVCRRDLRDANVVYDLGRDSNDRELRAHVECVVPPKRGS